MVANSFSSQYDTLLYFKGSHFCQISQISRPHRPIINPITTVFLTLLIHSCVRRHQHRLVR